jgi:hypothetical protein
MGDLTEGFGSGSRGEGRMIDPRGVQELYRYNRWANAGRSRAHRP